jgi:hypothetical protein
MRSYHKTHETIAVNTQEIHVVIPIFCRNLGFLGALSAKPGVGFESTCTPKGKAMRNTTHQMTWKTTKMVTTFIKAKNSNCLKTQWGGGGALKHEPLPISWSGKRQARFW